MEVIAFAWEKSLFTFFMEKENLLLFCLDEHCNHSRREDENGSLGSHASVPKMKQAVKISSLDIVILNEVEVFDSDSFLGRLGFSIGKHVAGMHYTLLDMLAMLTITALCVLGWYI